MSSEAHEDIAESLHTIFHQGLDLYNKISSSNEATNSSEIQRNIKKAIEHFEQATRLVSLADIFSKNEDFEELATNDIQYLLLPALLGVLTTKITCRDRKEIIEVAEVYFKDFLQRTNNYKLSNHKFYEEDEDEEEEVVEEPKNASTNNQTELELLTKSVNTRAHKIQRFRAHKELKAHLENLKKNVESEHADEDLKRQYFLTMIKVFIHDAVDELDSLNMEKPILQHMLLIKQEGLSKPKRQPPPPLRPIIITKDEIQKAVYGAGYPSLPTMTVAEFYEKRVAEGAFPDPNKPKTGPMSLQEASLAGIKLDDEDKEAEQLEDKIDEDDEEYVEKMRERDEWRDNHRRGWGNRMNRS